MKFIDLFAGIGGFRYGLENIKKSGESGQLDNGQQSPNASGNGENEQCSSFDCVYSNEYDKYANQIYKKHYGECDIRDIKTVKASEIPNHDLICAGFPCQSFSIAGKRLGFEDTRGTLFYEIVRIAKYKRPRYLLLENVKGLLSHDEGKTFQTILGVLSDIGYRVEWQVLNSKNFGVPQNRERVFIIGHLRGKSRGQVFPIGESNKEASKLQRQQVTGAITARRGTAQSDGDYIVKSKRKALQEITKNQSQGSRVYKTSGISQTLSSNSGGMGGKTGLYAFSSSQRKDHVESRIKEGEANCLTTGKGCATGIKSMSFVKEDMRIRRLTPLECERLQGFPDGWTEGLSDTQRYKCLGNAVTTNVVMEIGKSLKKQLKNK